MGEEIEGGKERVRRRRGNHGSGGCGGERRYVSTVGATMCFGGKKLTGRKKSYGQPEKQHRASCTHILLSFGTYFTFLRTCTHP
jgi:hypothetical protein